MTERLVAIGADLGACWRRLTEIQDLCIERPDQGSREDIRKRTRLKRDERCLAERTWALEAMATQLRAASLNGAIVQAVMAHRYLREIMESDLDEEERQATGRAIERLLYSLVACLEAETGTRREALFGTAYMPRDWDPYDAVRGALAGVAELMPRAAAAPAASPKRPTDEAASTEDDAVA